ncbi:MAG: ATP-binding protein [Pyrinomonadaceae bacterium]
MNYPPFTSETARLAALSQYEILETLPEPEFDDLTLLASQICQTPIALISLIDSERQWFKSKIGLKAFETSHDFSFCSHTIEGNSLLIVPDATKDSRFAQNSMVIGEPQIRFYAGAPLINEQGYAIGALCVIDNRPRQITSEQQHSLKTIARSVMTQIELRCKVSQYKKNENETRSSEAELLALLTESKHAAAALCKARDAALESDRFKSAFLANVSHEIRTPMSGVIGMTDLLLDTSLTAQQRDFAETIRTSANSLLSVINDILDISKIEAGKLQFEMINFNLSQIIEDLVSLLAEETRSKKNELSVDIEATVPNNLVGDPNRLRQVLLNLISNALKFTTGGKVSVTVSLSEETVDQAVLRFSVTDTGIGIDPDTQSKMFEPFVQADVSTTRRFGGTGLGLAICRQLVERMSGEIGVESQLGNGATFWFTARIGKSTSQTPTFEKLKTCDDTSLAAAGDFEISQSASKGLILLVEDDFINTKVAVSYLHKLGYEVECAANGREALAALYANHYDCVLMDCQMPDLDGFETTAAIRADEAQGKILGHTPIVATTANAMTGDRERCYAAGMDDYLSKPINLAELEKILSRWNQSHENQSVTKKADQKLFNENQFDSSPIDLNVLSSFSNLVADNPKFLDELLDLFLSDATKNVQSLQALTNEGKWREIALLAHRMKGSCGTFGANRLYDLCAELEAKCRKENVENISQIVSEIAAEFICVKDFLQKTQI